MASITIDRVSVTHAARQWGWAQVRLWPNDQIMKLINHRHGHQLCVHLYRSYVRPCHWKVSTRRSDLQVSVPGYCNVVNQIIWHRSNQVSTNWLNINSLCWLNQFTQNDWEKPYSEYFKFRVQQLLCFLCSMTEFGKSFLSLDCQIQACCLWLFPL